MIPTTFALFERIEIGGVAPIGAVSGQLGKIAVLLQIRQCRLTVLRERFISLAIVLIPGQQLPALLDRSLRYI